MVRALSSAELFACRLQLTALAMLTSNIAPCLLLYPTVTLLLTPGSDRQLAAVGKLARIFVCRAHLFKEVHTDSAKCVSMAPQSRVTAGAAYLRYTALDRDMSRYSCCQGYMDNVCFKSGKCGEKSCPEFCLCVEVFMCIGPSISSTRMMVMDQYEIRPDPCDNRIIRLTNCLMLLSCFCDLLSICVKEVRHLANLLHSVANCVAYSTIGCMASQVFREVAYRREYKDEYAGWADGDKLNSPIMGHTISYQDAYQDGKYPL